MSKIDQKEYLKRYLMSDEKLGKKKKKKSKDKQPKITKKTVKIIDDSAAAFDQYEEVDEGDLYATNEEAPQIVGIVDERSASVILKQEYQESGKWKTLENHKTNEKKHKQHDETSSRVTKKYDKSPKRSPKRNRKNSDASPPRKNRKSSDESPIRRNRKYSDESPPRRSHQNSNESSRKSRWNHEEKSQKRSRKDSDESPPRKSIAIKQEPLDDYREKSRHRRNSPPQRLLQSIKQERLSTSPQRSLDIKKERSKSPRSSKMSRTLDGKVAGLQNAKSLKVENERFRARQDKMFREMDENHTGKNADVVIRDRRGRNKDFEYDVEKERQKMKAEEERKREYDRWGKGLKQLEDIEKKRQEYLHEASKPLARSENDTDLQDYLKDQERLDDPMLMYMRRKKAEENKAKGIVEKPKYKGDFPDNRFNIRPGYRWDGVDRSNGYEKKYFAMINSKKSLEEEAYRYSTEDM